MKNVRLALVGLFFVGSIANANPTIRGSDGTVEVVQPALLALQSKATLLGFAKNEYELGMAYYDGKLVPRNAAKAAEWLIKASKKNYAPAMFVLGKMLIKGDGVEKNIHLGAELLTAAANKNNKDALEYINSLNQQLDAKKNAQHVVFVPITNPEPIFPSEAYKTTMDTQVGYVFSFDIEDPSSPDEEHSATLEDNGLYLSERISIDKKILPKDFPLTLPTVVEKSLLKKLKLDTTDVVSKLKKSNKNKYTSCIVRGQMMAQFELHYEGGDFFRFPHEQVWTKIYSARPLGVPKIECEK